MSTNTGYEANKPVNESNQGSPPWNRLPKLSLSQWLAIVAAIGGITGAFYLFYADKTLVDVYVPARELPPNYQIQPSDLTPKPYASGAIPLGTLRTAQEIVGRSTYTKLPKDKPLTDSQLDANVKGYLPVRELPAYHQIQLSDLTPKPYASRSVPSDTLRTAQEIVGRYTLTPLPKDKLLTDSQLGVKVNPTCLTNTIAVSLPATPAMTFGGNLKAGETVSITFGSTPADKESTLPSPALFSNLLVLDVKAVSQASTPFTSVIVIALPKTAVQAFVTHLPGATALVGLDLSGKRNSCVI